MLFRCLTENGKCFFLEFPIVTLCTKREKTLLVSLQSQLYETLPFSFFRKGYISAQDLAQVFALLNESVTEDEITSKSRIEDFLLEKFLQTCFLAMIRIAGVKSNDKINFKEFVEFFYKVD